VDAPLLGGSTTPVDVPSGTPSGHVVRLKGKGLPGLRGGRGDLHVRLRVWVPSRVSGPEKKKLEDLRGSDGLKPPQPSRSVFGRVRDGASG
jgi:molecular chaperone DnaJ